MVIPAGLGKSHENKGVGETNPGQAPKTKQALTNSKPNYSPGELASFWSLPIAPIAMLAAALGTTPQGVGRLGFPTIRIGGGLFVRPVEITHALRAVKAEVRS